VYSTLGAAILGLRAIGPAGAATAGLSCRGGKHVSPPVWRPTCSGAGHSAARIMTGQP